MYLKKIVEQIRRKYYGGHIPADASLKFGEVRALVFQTINRLFKKSTIRLQYGLEGNRVPPHHSLMTYDVSVAASGELIITVSCSVWPGLNAADFWAVPDGQFWDTGDESGYWLFDVTDSVIEVVQVSTGVYTVTINTLVFDTGYDENDLVTWINAAASGTYIELVGVDEAHPSKFATDGISGLTAVTDGITFTYTIANATNFAGDVETAIIESHSRLEGIAGAGDTNISIANFRVCTPSSNTDYRKGQITLPTMPIDLPMGMGVWRVYDPKSPFTNYIPLSAGQFDLMNSISHTNMNNVLASETAYEWFDYQTLLFNQSVATLPDTVSVQLVVTDMDKLSDTDLLPIPADYEEVVIDEVYKLLQPNRPEDVYVDQNEMT